MGKGPGPCPAAADARLSDLEEALRFETLASERLRALAVAGFMGALLLITSVYGRVLMSRLRPPPGNVVGASPSVSIQACIIAFLLLALADAWLISRALHRRSLRASPAIPYVSAFVETLLPTLLIFDQATSMPELAFTAWTGKLYYLFIILSTLRLNFWLSLFMGASSALQLLGLAALILPRTPVSGGPDASVQGQLLHAALLLLAGILAGGVGLQLRRQLVQTLAAVSTRDRVTELFGRHVSSPVAEHLLQSPDADAAELQQVCVLLLDIRGFTKWARTRAPEEAMSLLDETLAQLVEVVDAHQGFVNKFLGDGFLALFGGPIADPQAAAHAVAAARGMLAAVERGNQTRPWPIRVGIGIHLGPAVAGTVGSPRRKEYTVIGDTVNLASRIEEANKEYGSQLLISQQVLDAAGEAAKGATPVGPVALRGYAGPVPLWRLD